MSTYYSRLYNHRSSGGYDSIGRPTSSYSVGVGGIGPVYQTSYPTSSILSPLWPKPTSSTTYRGYNTTPTSLSRESSRDMATSSSSRRQSGASGANSGTNAATNPVTPRRSRYSRSSTSVAQMLSDSCQSLLQRISTRMRGSSTADRAAAVPANLNSSSKNTSAQNAAPKKYPSPTVPANKASVVTETLGITRSRLEDKYSAVLNRISGKKPIIRDENFDPERTLEPSVGRTLTPSAGSSLIKSATTANVILSEKAYPYVTVQPMLEKAREKTPYRTTADHKKVASHYMNHYNEPYYGYLEHDSAYHHAPRHKSHQKESHQKATKRTVRPLRPNRSETTNLLKLCPVEIPIGEEKKQRPKSTYRNAQYNSNDYYNQAPVMGYLDGEITPTPACQDEISEREAKRKEIQSLIMKYSALDEVYNRAVQNTADSIQAPSMLPMPAPPGVPNAMTIPNQIMKSATMAAISTNNQTHHKYYQHHKDTTSAKVSSKLTSTVSRMLLRTLASCPDLT